MAGDALLNRDEPARGASGAPVVGVLDGFRGIAVMAIVLLHLLSTEGTRELLPDGILMDMGIGLLPRMIDVLFIVSGFVLFMPTVARRGQFGDVVSYAVRRAARILPTYYLVLAIVLLLAVAVPALRVPSFSAYEIGAHLTVMQSPARLFDQGFPVGLEMDGALWTISALVCFYIVLPLVAKPYFRHPFAGLAIAGAITVVWRELVDQELALFGFGGATLQLPYWAWHLGLGMTAAWLYYKWLEPGLRERMRRWAPRAQLIALAGIVVVLYLRPAPFEGDLLAGIYAASRSLPVSIAFPALLTLFMLATAEAPRRWRLGLDGTPARRLGEASYGIYMIHIPILLVVIRLHLLPPPRWGLRFLAEVALVVPASLLFGWLAFRYLETPIRERARAWSRGREADSRPPRLRPGATPAQRKDGEVLP